MGLGRRFIAGYGVAHGGKSLFWHAGELLLGFVFTEVWRMPPQQAGEVLAVSMLVSGCTDLVAGKLLGQRIKSAHDAAYVQWLASLACGAAFVALGLASFFPGIRNVLGLGALFAFRLCYAFVDVPQNVLLAIASRNDEGRAMLSAIRYVAGGIASVAVTAGIAPALVGTERPSAIAPFAALLITIALVAVVTASHLRRTTQAECVTLKNIASVAASNAQEPTQIKGDKFAIFLVMLLVSAGLSVFCRLEPYYVAYGARLDGAAFMICVTAGSVISQPGWWYASRRIPLAQVLGLASLTLIIAAWAFARLAHADKDILVMIGILSGAANGGVLTGLWALAAQIAGGSGNRASMTQVMAVFTFSSKMGLACAAYMAGLILQVVDYHSMLSTDVTATMALVLAVGGAASFMLSVKISANEMREKRTLLEKPTSAVSPARF